VPPSGHRIKPLQTRLNAASVLIDELDQEAKGWFFRMGFHHPKIRGSTVREHDFYDQNMLFVKL
jgi:hypothetical protein